jgi:hypothetical protein
MNQRGTRFALILLQVRINIAKIVIIHLHYLLLKVQTLQNPITPATLYMRAVSEFRGKKNKKIILYKYIFKDFDIYYLFFKLKINIKQSYKYT